MYAYPGNVAVSSQKFKENQMAGVGIVIRRSYFYDTIVFPFV